MSGDPDATSAHDDPSERVAQAADERRRLRASRRQEVGRTSMRELLVGAAERAAPVSVLVGGGRSHRVRVDAVGDGVLVASTDGMRELIVGLGALRGVIVHGAAEVAPGGYVAGATTVGFDMADILTDRLTSRPRISVWHGPEQITGTMVAVGGDVVAISLEGVAATAYVRLDSTTEISLSASSSA